MDNDSKLLAEAYGSVQPQPKFVSLSRQLSEDFVIQKKDIRPAIELLEKTFGAHFRWNMGQGQIKPYSSSSRLRAMEHLP